MPFRKQRPPGAALFHSLKASRGKKAQLFVHHLAGIVFDACTSQQAIVLGKAGLCEVIKAYLTCYASPELAEFLTDNPEWLGRAVNLVLGPLSIAPV